ncbi:hypothetical protein H072_10321 [Dactylellina haptotyla CBS 200.50]|uniref:Uncharacterized protein n=1 Tax=Dactylellina haptotyla (strain CBS 200.50) TaxID=1284197 RepID=S8A4T3_DACHA|nr:hypothetical protein H072_10321 [Dactylellina haptotyla CBS 200.50]
MKLSTILIALPLLTGVLGFDHPVPNKRVVLVPIRARQLYPYLSKRDDDLSVLDPKDTITLNFGGIVSSNHAQRARVKIYKPDSHHSLLALEGFDHLTSTVVCKKDELTLKFKSKAAMEYAVKKWHQTVTGGNSFYMIAHPDHKTCHTGSKNMERTAFDIKSIRDDSKSMTVTLSKVAAPWKKVAANMDISLKNYAGPVKGGNSTKIHKNEPRPYQNRVARIKRELEARADDASFFDDLKQSVVQAFPEAVLIPLSAGNSDPSNKARIIQSENFKQDAEFFTADCVSCYAEGSVNVNTDAQVRDGVRTVTAINVETKVKGRLGIELNIRGFMQYDFNIINTFFKTAVPFSNIPGIANINPTFLPGPGFRIYGTFEGKINFGFDLDVDITQNIKISGSGEDGQKPEEPTANKMDITPFADVTLSGNGTFEPYFRIGVGLGVSVLEETASAGFFVGYRLVAPITAGMKMTSTDVGTCEGSGHTSVYLDTKISFQDGWKLGVKVEGGKFLDVLYDYFNLGYFEAWKTIKELQGFSKCFSLGDAYDGVKKMIEDSIKEEGKTVEPIKPDPKPKFWGPITGVPSYMRLRPRG